MVEKLLDLISEILPALPDDVLKQRLLASLKDFEVAITPSAIGLDEVYELAARQEIELSHEQAISILQNTAVDIDLNYASEAVEYHVDECINSEF